MLRHYKGGRRDCLVTRVISLELGEFRSGLLCSILRRTSSLMRLRCVSEARVCVQVKELAEDFAVTCEFLVAHCHRRRNFFAQAGEATCVTPGEVVIDGSKISRSSAAGAFEVG